MVALPKIIQRIESIPRVMQQISEAMAEEALALIDDGFFAEKDPYGQPWKNKKKPGRIGQVTGQMRRGWIKTFVGPNGFRLKNLQPYSGYFQDGTKNSPERNLVPTARKGLGPIWSKALRKVALECLRRAAGG